MSQKYHEFLFKLRSSEFSHHTPEKVAEMLFEAKNRLTMPPGFVNHFFSQLDGEPGFFSNNSLSNIKYTIVGCSYLLSAYAIENGVDPERAYSTGDYYIHRADEVCNYKQLNDLFDEMTEMYRTLLQSYREPAYGYPIDKCIHYISQNLFSPLTAKKVAEYMNMTPEYLTTLFKAHTGEAIYQFILNKKIEEAKSVLQHTSASIVNIASALGFNSTSHFSTSFKGRTGLSPSQYRKQQNHALLW